jgi:hypothetical protein
MAMIFADILIQLQECGEDYSGDPSQILNENVERANNALPDEKAVFLYNGLLYNATFAIVQMMRLLEMK